MPVPLADGSLVAAPEVPDAELVPDFLAASDVLGTGWFAAVAAEAGPGKTVAVVGDGAVGLLGVLAAQQLSHVHLHGGPAPVRRFLPDLMDRIWHRTIRPGRVFDLELPLEEAAAGYRAMDARQAIKVLLRL
jgi:threonine dehydrogenase-like Zn-dependent dehydrogenase